MKTMRAEREARISFATPELLWDVLSAKTLGPSQGPVRRRPRVDPGSGAQGQTRCESGPWRRNGAAPRRCAQPAPDGRIEFPFEAVKVDFF